MQFCLSRLRISRQTQLLLISLAAWVAVTVASDTEHKPTHDELCETRVQSGNLTAFSIRYGNVSLDWTDPQRNIIKGPMGYGLPMTIHRQTFALKIQPDRYPTFVPSHIARCQLGVPSSTERCKSVAFSGGWLSETPGELLSSSGNWELDGMNVTTCRYDMDFETQTQEKQKFPFKVAGYGFIIDEDWSEEPENPDQVAYLGLQEDSWFFEQMGELSAIPSKVWGFFAGWTGVTPDTIQDGSLVVGGYDNSKINGSFATFPISKDPDCALLINVKEVRVFGEAIYADDSTFTYKQTPIQFEACIDPTINGIVVPMEYNYRMRTPLSAFYNETHYGEYFFPVDFNEGVYAGAIAVPTEHINSNVKKRGIKLHDPGMTFVTDSLDMHIPIHQMLQPPREITPSGISLLKNQNMTIIPLYEGPKDSQRVRLGSPFLAGNYLFVNLENGTFSIAPILNDPTERPPVLITMIDSKPCSLAASTNKNRLSRIQIGLISAIIVSGTFVFSMLLFLGHRRYIVWRMDSLPDLPYIYGIPEVDSRQKYHLDSKEVPTEASGAEIYHKGDDPEPLPQAVGGVEAKPYVAHEMEA